MAYLFDDKNFTFQSGSIQINCKHTAFNINLYFTFQSGSIQILSWPHFFCCASSFTFQSGSIQIPFKRQLSDFLKAFTFQSGSIQIFVTSPFSSMDTVFTFQSGSIQMTLKFKAFISFAFLYIPIWFYSNWLKACYRNVLYTLYIPIWFYSNITLESSPTRLSNFTFQSGSIQIKVLAEELSEHEKTLHSNMVLFK